MNGVNGYHGKTVVLLVGSEFKQEQGTLIKQQSIMERNACIERRGRLLIWGIGALEIGIFPGYIGCYDHDDRPYTHICSCLCFKLEVED